MPLNKGILFIHIPKCGGHSIERAMGIPHKSFSSHEYSYKFLFGNELQHLTFREAEIILPDKSFEKSFTVLRNPIDRLISEYNWSGNWSGASAFIEERVKVSLDRNDRILDRHLLPQSQFVCGENQLQEIFTFGQFDAIADYIGVKQIPHLNRALGPKKDIFLLEEMSVIAKKYYADDFDLLNDLEPKNKNSKDYYFLKDIKLLGNEEKISSYTHYACEKMIIYKNEILQKNLRKNFEFWSEVENGKKNNVVNWELDTIDEVKIFWLLNNMRRNEGVLKYLKLIFFLKSQKIKLSRRYLFSWTLYKIIQKVSKSLIQS